jgi:hypothetical protein
MAKRDRFTAKRSCFVVKRRRFTVNRDAFMEIRDHFTGLPPRRAVEPGGCYNTRSNAAW